MLKTQNYLEKLRNSSFHKLIVGAALKDYKKVEEFSELFTYAKADMIDISAFPLSVISSKAGIKKAIEKDPSLNAPMIMVSVNIGQDPHFRRIEVNWDNCTECLACVPSCPSEAFSSSVRHPNISRHPERSEGSQIQLVDSLPLAQNDEIKFSYNENLCFGCSNCLPECNFSALEFDNWSAFDTNSLEELIELGARAIEIHLNKDLSTFKSFYKTTPSFELESFCIGSHEETELELINACTAIIDSVIEKGFKPFIIQTDGVPMSGAINKDKSADLVTIEKAKIVRDFVDKNYPELKDQIFVQLAGGTTDKTLSKAKSLGVNVNGVAIGSFARREIQNSTNKIDKAISIIENSSK